MMRGLHATLSCMMICVTFFLQKKTESELHVFSLHYHASIVKARVCSSLFQFILLLKCTKTWGNGGMQATHDHVVFPLGLPYHCTALYHFQLFT
jgi:hypothetical protein